MKTTLKLCVLYLLVLGPALLLAACGTTGTALQTADTWAKRVCSLIQQLPEASASVLPPNVNVTVIVTPSVAVASVGPAPTVVSSSSASTSTTTAPTDAVVPHALGMSMPPNPSASMAASVVKVTP